MGLELENEDVKDNKHKKWISRAFLYAFVTEKKETHRSNNSPPLPFTSLHYL